MRFWTTLSSSVKPINLNRPPGEMKYAVRQWSQVKT